jgi:eukaryotic-like serine/threonine-protein kinase
LFKADESIAGYRIVSKLGAGGMGEVWRAEDTKLGRQVALKVLPADVADDGDRLARLEREAKVLASLNHPNIAMLFGLETASPCHSERAERVEESPEAQSDASGPGSSQRAPQSSGGPSTPVPSDGTSAQDDTRSFTFLAMELVEGEDLSERIKRGPIPVDEAVPIALQIARALEAAHQQGIVHRDLKPANIKLTKDGAVKVLDFGLAKAWEAESTDNSLSLSPTMTQHATAAGIILGTAGYMAPEQAAGQGTDTRADVWSFGVVLWEMLTGVKLFDGETVSHVLAAVLTADPDLSSLPEDTPPRITDLIGRCLRKKPKMRVQAIGDVRIALEEYLADPESSAAPVERPIHEAPVVPTWKRVFPWAVAGALLVALVAAILLRPQESLVFKATIPPPEGTQFDLRPASPGPAVVAPDGSKIAFTALDEDGRTRVFIRRLDAGKAHALSGTVGAQYPFWSPDSRWLGFFTQPDDVLRKIDTNGGPPITLCPASNGKGGAWSRDGVIVFSADASSGLSRVPVSGGEAVELTVRDTSRHNSHRFPWILPDGRHFLFVARGVAGEESTIMVGSLDGGEPVELLNNGSQAIYASGRLLFVRDQTLMAQDFDPDSLTMTGEAFPVAEDVLVIPGASLSVFGASANGVLTFQTGSAIAETTLEWRDRSGRSEGSLGDAALYRLARISPDGGHVMVQVVDIESGTQDLWVYEVDRGIRTRFTFDPLADVSPVWSPDGETVFFSSNRSGKFDVYRKPLSGVGEAELVAEFERNAFPDSVSPDGRYLAVLTEGVDTADILIVDLERGGESSVFRQTEFNEGGAVISPDGRWMAYHSDEGGDFAVFVTTFPKESRKWQVSTAQGVYPEWRDDGREIVYTDYNGMLHAVEVDGSDATFEVGEAEELFAIEPPDQGGSFFSLAADGERILVIPGVTQQANTLLNLVVNWPVATEARR